MTGNKRALSLLVRVVYVDFALCKLQAICLGFGWGNISERDFVARILIVEDYVILRHSLAKWLRVEGHDVLEATSADEATVILNSILSIDLVVTDIEMPGSMNGLDLAENIRNRFAALPVIVVSGEPFVDRLRTSAVTAFFPKPYDLGRLSAYISTVLPQVKADPKKSEQA
ncbi:MAG: response regulator [Rhodopila sp.]